jgi:DUF2934 family protein
MAATKKTLASSEVSNDVLEQIARRAYELYLWRGREDGHDLDDWLQAETEIKGEAAKAA